MKPAAGTLEDKGVLSSAMCLPDSFGGKHFVATLVYRRFISYSYKTYTPYSLAVIHIGETFTAYLGALNVSKTLPVSRLTVSAQLQTPSQRWVGGYDTRQHPIFALTN